MFFVESSFRTCGGGSSTRVRLFQNFKLAGGVPAGLVENDQRMRATRDRTADLVDGAPTAVGVGVRHDEGPTPVSRAGQTAVGILVAPSFGWRSVPFLAH